MELTEKWLAVVGFEGIYEVSDKGRVRSVDRISRHGHRLRGRERKPFVKSGYSIVGLCVGSHDRKYRVHRLVLEAFVGPCPFGQEALHQNGDRSDNRIENLRWGTRSQNVKDAVTHGTHNMTAKNACPRGHVYDHVSTNGKKFVRVCRACAWARKFIQRHDVPEDPAIADWFYRTAVEPKLSHSSTAR